MTDRLPTPEPAWLPRPLPPVVIERPTEYTYLDPRLLGIAVSTSILAGMLIATLIY